MGQGYAAPEITRGEHYSTAVDVYSFAILATVLYTRKEPFYSHRFDDSGMAVCSWQQLSEMISRRGLRPQLPDTMSARMEYLVRECWNDDPHQRPNFESILYDLGGMEREISGKGGEEKWRDESGESEIS